MTQIQDDLRRKDKEAPMMNQLKIEDLPPVYRILANLIGVENAILIGKEFGGINLYIPKLDNAVTKARDREILVEFNGCNYADLARKHHLSDVHIRDIIKKARPKGIEKNSHGQGAKTESVKGQNSGNRHV
jgi:hypothetical protein